MSDIIIGRKRKDIRKQLRGNTFGGNIMKRKNIKNDKVLRAITIGLATMIAATSAPLNVYADGPATADGAGGETTGETAGGGEQAGVSGEAGGGEQAGGSGDTTTQQTGSNGEAGGEQNTNNSVEVTDENVKGGIDAANELFESATDSIEPVINNEGVATDGGLLPEAINTAVAAGQVVDANDGITTAAEDLITAAGAVAETEQDLKNVKTALGNLEEPQVTPFEYVGEQVSDNKTVAVKVLPSEIDEEKYGDKNEHLKTTTEQDAEGNDIPAPIYVDGQIALEEPTDGGLLVKSFYEDYSKAIGLAQKGDAESLKEAKKIAEDASEKLEQENIKVENLKEAIKDSAAAQKAVAAAKDKLQKIEEIRTQYEAFMNTYYKQMNGNSYIADDFDNQAKLVSDKDLAKDTQDKNNYDASAAGNSFDLGNELTKKIVELELLEEGASDITWSSIKARPNPGDVDGPAKGESKDNGRYNYLTVKYTDKDGNIAYKYVNDIFKDSFYGEQESDRTSGVIYISERFDTDGDWNPDTKWQEYDPTSTKYYDNYKRIPNAVALEKAREAVKAAEEKANMLQAKVNALAKAATGVDEPALIEKELEKAEKALENSEQKLNVLRELLGLLSERQEKEATVTPDPKNENPSEDNITDDDDTTDDDDDTTGGDETPGAAGGVVFDPSTGTFSAPAYGFGSTILPGFTGGPATGVLGVRTDGGTEADEGGVADSRTNVAPRANFSTVNKVLGSRQNKDNSQLAKKIKDNEIPLAEIPNMDDEVTMNWMWLLIIFLLGATGKKMYDEYKKKKEAEEAAKINK